jgi:hypothetical protein
LYFREHPEDQIDGDVSYSKLHSTGIILELTYQPDEYNLTWERLSSDLFRYVASHLSLERDIVPLLCVCKKMTIKVIRELCYVTGCYPDIYSCIKLYSWIQLKSACRVFPSSSFHLHPLLISYRSPWCHMVKDPCLIIRCLIINLQTELTYSTPPQNIWDLSNLDSLMIKMSKGFDQNQQVGIYDYYSSRPWSYNYGSFQSCNYDYYSCQLSKRLFDHLDSNLEFIQLVNCQLELPCNINLKKFKYLKGFTIHFKSMEDASCESCLDLTKCTIMFPRMLERLKFKEDLVLKVL